MYFGWVSFLEKGFILFFVSHRDRHQSRVRKKNEVHRRPRSQQRSCILPNPLLCPRLHHRIRSPTLRPQPTRLSQSFVSPPSKPNPNTNILKTPCNNSPRQWLHLTVLGRRLRPRAKHRRATNPRRTIQPHPRRQRPLCRPNRRGASPLHSRTLLRRCACWRARPGIRVVVPCGYSSWSDV